MYTHHFLLGVSSGRSDETKERDFTQFNMFCLWTRSTSFYLWMCQVTYLNSMSALMVILRIVHLLNHDWLFFWWDLGTFQKNGFAGLATTIASFIEEIEVVCLLFLPVVVMAWCYHNHHLLGAHESPWHSLHYFFLWRA